MPNYHCSNCGRPFETEVGLSDQPDVMKRCPDCAVFLQFRSGVPHWVEASERGIEAAANKIDELREQIREQEDLIELITKYGISVSKGEPIDIQARGRSGDETWTDVTRPSWLPDMEYRERPKACPPPKVGWVQLPSSSSTLR